MRQQWVDAFRGYKSALPGETRSGGERIYLHGIEVDCVAAAAYPAECPPEVELPLPLRRVHGGVGL